MTISIVSAIASMHGFRDKSGNINRSYILTQAARWTQARHSGALLVFPAGFLCLKNRSETEERVQTFYSLTQKIAPSITISMGVDTCDSSYTKSLKQQRADTENGNLPFLSALWGPNQKPFVHRQRLNALANVDVAGTEWTETPFRTYLAGGAVEIVSCGEFYSAKLKKRIRKDVKSGTVKAVIVPAHVANHLNLNHWLSSISKAGALALTCAHAETQHTDQTWLPDGTQRLEHKPSISFGEGKTSLSLYVTEVMDHEYPPATGRSLRG